MLALPCGFVLWEPRQTEALSIGLFAPATAFGDMWRICSQACRASRLGFKVSINPVSRMSSGVSPVWPKNRQPNVDHTKFCKEILSLLDGGGAVTVSKSSLPNCHVEVNAYVDPWPTKSRWVGGAARICYQFDGFGDADIKCPPAVDVKAFLKKCDKLGLEVQNLGGMRPIPESIKLVLTSQLFVGIDSGLTQLAYSTGIPVDLVMYGTRRCAWRNWHQLCPRRQLHSLEHWGPEIELPRDRSGLRERLAVPSIVTAAAR